MIKSIPFADHNEWLSIRNKYIGGSDASAVIGLNPYRSRYALWAEKTGKVPGFEGNTITRVGAYLEEFVANLFEEETGKKVRRKNFTLVNDLYPFACANLDRVVVGEKALLEIKTTTNSLVMKQLKGSEFPECYYAQVTHYLAVTGYEKAYLAVLVNCRELKIYELERDQAEIDALMSAEKDFWNLVETNTEPAIDGSDSTSDTLAALYPASPDAQSDLYQYETAIDKYFAIDKQIKELTALKDEISNNIKATMKNAEKGETLSYKVSYATSERCTFDSKQFKMDHPEISFIPYNKTTIVRTFKITKKGK